MHWGSNVDHMGQQMVYLGSCGGTDYFDKIQFLHAGFQSDCYFVFLYKCNLPGVYEVQIFIWLTCTICVHRRVAGAVFARPVIRALGLRPYKWVLTAVKWGCSRV